VTDSEVIQSYVGHTAQVNDVVNIKDLVITASEDNTIRIYDKLSANTLRTLQGHQAPVTKIKIVNLDLNHKHNFYDNDNI
jgi:WD40 repeat protein